MHNVIQDGRHDSSLDAVYHAMLVKAKQVAVLLSRHVCSISSTVVHCAVQASTNCQNRNLHRSGHI